MIVALLGIFLYRASTNDINYKSQLDAIVSEISWYNNNLSGLKQERTELEKQQTNLTMIGNGYRDKIKELESKKDWLEIFLGIKKPKVEATGAVELLDKSLGLSQLQNQ